MPFYKEQISAVINDWIVTQSTRELPKWDDFPALPLYMDQVIILLNQYLYSADKDDNEDHSVTPAMVNNYVKLKIVPRPVKKRYGRIHLAYLVMVCILKQTMNIPDIPLVLPETLTEEETCALYNHFVEIYRQMSGKYAEFVKILSEPILTSGSTPANRVLIHLAVSATLSKSLADKLIDTARPKEESRVKEEESHLHKISAKREARREKEKINNESV